MLEAPRLHLARSYLQNLEQLRHVALQGLCETERRTMGAWPGQVRKVLEHRSHLHELSASDSVLDHIEHSTLLRWTFTQFNNPNTLAVLGTANLLVLKQVDFLTTTRELKQRSVGSDSNLICNHGAVLERY